MSIDSVISALLDEPSCAYNVLTKREAAFDGRFFVGVRTTGIYCRPICKVRIPNFDSCRFYADAVSAERAGFRPCLQCRPELAPGIFTANTNLVARASRQIEDGASRMQSLQQLAHDLGVSSPQLESAVSASGVCLLDFAESQRCRFAKQLFTETTWSAKEIAAASGFANSVACVGGLRKRYRFERARIRHRPVARCQSNPRTTHDAPHSTLRIEVRPPFDFDALLRFLAQRAMPGVEMINGNTYFRTVELTDARGWLAVTRARTTPNSPPALAVSFSDALKPVCKLLLARVKNLIDARACPNEIDSVLIQDRLLEPSVDTHPGLRVPGAFDGFEVLLRAILGQLVSVKSATTLAGRLAGAIGTVVTTPFSALNRLSPSATQLADAKVDHIAQIGLPRKRAEAISRAARAYAEGKLVLMPGCDVNKTRDALIEIPGIGGWTAAYVVMRALGEVDTLLVGDLGLKKAVGVTSDKALIARTESWRPWRAYGAMHAWLTLAESLNSCS